MNDERLKAIKVKLEWANTVLYRAWGKEDIDAEADIEDLLAEVERLRAENKRLRALNPQNLRVFVQYMDGGAKISIDPASPVIFGITGDTNE